MGGAPAKNLIHKDYKSKTCICNYELSELQSLDYAATKKMSNIEVKFMQFCGLTHIYFLQVRIMLYTIV